LDFNNLDEDKIQIRNKNVLYFKKIILPTDEEKKNHSQYLKSNLKKNYFN